LGELTDILKDYKGMAFGMLLSWPENLLDPVITIKKVDIVFFINGSKRGEMHYQPNISADYSAELKALIPGKANLLIPTVVLTEKPIDVLKFSL
jgi:hypothetical protein